MPWRPVPQAFAICIHPFRATQNEDLPLQIGDRIYIIEQGGKNNEWYRGYLVTPPSLLSALTSGRGRHLNDRYFTGIFPRNCVEVREVLDDNKATGKPPAPRIGGLDGADDEDDPSEKRKSQAQQGRRLSKAVTRKRSLQDVPKRDRPPLVDPNEPIPRDLNAPKPLAPVPLLRVGDETGQSVEEPLVDEIASCLREWHDATLHEILLARSYIQLGRVQELVERLDKSRKQLMHDVMTVKELQKLREDTVWDLVAGNKMLNDEIIVRNPIENGRILTAHDSAIEMTKLQANMSILDRPPKPAVDVNMQYHILVDVRSIVGEFGEAAALQIYLCTKEFGEKPKPVSENYALSLPLPVNPPQSPEDQAKTLFVNLNGADIGIGSDARQVYVVFKLLKDEPVRQAAIGQPSVEHRRQASTTADPNTPPPQKYGSLKGRRSILGVRAKNDGIARTSENPNRPETAQSQRSKGHSNGNSVSEPPPSRELKTVKRVVGVGAIDIGKLAQQQSEVETAVTLWTPASSVDEDRSDEKDEWQEILREMHRSANGGYSRVGLMKRFEVFATAFASSDLDALIRNNPTLLYNVHMTHKLGFSGVPTQKRSDIYLTLTEPLVERNAALQHSKFGNVPLNQRCQSSMANLQLTLEVRRANGERIEDCVFTASNNQGHTAWRTTGIERGEAWNQTIKLVIPTEDVPGSHIVMSIADSPNFPFALAWVPLWESDAFVRDGDHQVALYVYDEYSSSIIGGKGAYLALPPWHEKKHEPAHGTSATVSVRTYLCSTEYSQDPTLLGLLRWRNFHGVRLVELLERFSFVPEIEIVKLLGDIFDALFEILHEYANSQVYEDIIFHNFVIILGIARDRRFNLGNVIEKHASTKHDWPYASQCLLRAYQRLVSNPMDPETSRKLRETLKVGDQMLKLIVETRKDNQEDRSGSINENLDSPSDERHPNFDRDLQKLFVALMALMRNPMAVLLGTQTLVLQHFHSWLPELSSVMQAADVLEIATDLLGACAHAKGKMVLYRLILIVNYSHLDVFKPPEIRTTLIANTFRWLAPYWGETNSVTDQWRDQVRFCCSIVAAQMEELGEDSCQYVPKLVASFTELQNANREPKKSFSLLFPTAYPFPSKSTPSEVEVDEVLLEISALLAAALTRVPKLYFDANQYDVSGVLLQALKVVQSILNGEAFPRSWLSLHVSHHRFAMSALERIFGSLVEAMPDSNTLDMEEAVEFDTELWRAFFDTLFTAVSSPALAMETFPEQKRRAIWKIAGDVRETGADLIKRSWNAIGWETEEESRKLFGFERMGGYQVSFVPDLIPPIVELCLSVHASLRNVAIEVLRTMIISNWEIEQDLGVIQSAMVDCLDKLCRTKQVTESMLQTTFIDEMDRQFTPLQNTIEDSLYIAVRDMFAKIKQLLGMLASVHQGGAINETTRIVDTLRLMEFLKDVQSEEAYIRYVHQLAVLQSTAGNHTEAGLALRMHADRLEWDPATQLEEMADPSISAQTAFERKEALYFELCGHFERGQAWQSALNAYRELAHQYEYNVFDFSKLARAQRAMASIYDKIAKGERSNVRYFRVIYKGMGFQASLRDKQFIFEGLPTDRLASFEERMQIMHPGAQIIRPNTEADVEGQYLQVYPVSRNKDLDHMIYQRTKVSQAAREHALLSNPQKFTSTSRAPQHDVPLLEQMVEKNIYTTAEPFPTLLRRSEIVHSETVILSQIQAAVERTTRKTHEMLSLEKRISSGEDDSAMSTLSDQILLSVDPDSDSSVSRYRSLLPKSEQSDAVSVEADFTMLEAEEDQAMDPMQNALKVALLDHALAIKRCLGLFTGSAHRATRAEYIPRFEATYEHELAILFPDTKGLMGEPSPRSSLHERDAAGRGSRGTDAQASSGAHQDEGNEYQHQEPETRRSRRRSIPFLKRMASSSSQRQENGATDERDGGRSSRQGSRSRQRGESLTRRLSFFRNEQQQYEAGLTGARTNSVSSKTDKQETRGLKKRLSFLRTAGNSGLNSSGAVYRDL